MGRLILKLNSLFSVHYFKKCNHADPNSVEVQTMLASGAAQFELWPLMLMTRVRITLDSECDLHIRFAITKSFNIHKKQFYGINHDDMDAKAISVIRIITRKTFGKI